jgi:hypothetical protein
MIGGGRNRKDETALKAYATAEERRADQTVDVSFEPPTAGNDT